MDLFTRIRAVAGAVEATSTQSRKIATAEGSIRYRVTSYCSASVGANSLIIGKEEQFALDNRPSDAAAELALNARAMTAYHQLLSVGSTARPPRVAVTFDSGLGAPAPTPAQLSQLAKSARTPTDQRVLEEYFLNVARAETAKADAHAVMGQMQRTGATRGLNDPAAHCDRMVKLARAASTKATADAELHRQLANIG